VLGRRVRGSDRQGPGAVLGFRVRRDLPAGLVARLRARAVGRFVDGAGGVWVWDAFAVRYVRSAAGARRYGVPIGSPIPPGKKARGGGGGRGGGGRGGGGRGGSGGGSGGAAPTGGSTGGDRVRLTPAQRDAAERHLGTQPGAGRGAYLDGNQVVVEDRDLAVAALDRILAGSDLTPGQRKARKNLRDKIAATGSDTSTPTPDPSPPVPDPASPPAPDPSPPTAAGQGFDEARVQANARAVQATVQAAIDRHVDGFLGSEAGRISRTELGYLTQNYLAGTGGDEVRAAIRGELARQYPDATDIDLDTAERSVMGSINRGLEPSTPSDPPAGRGAELAVRALERQRSMTGRPLADVVTEARDTVGDPRYFGRDINHADGGPGERSIEQLNAVRDAGASVAAEANRRIAELRAARAAQPDPLAAYDEAAAAHRGTVEALQRDMRADWRRSFGEDMPGNRMQSFLDNPYVEVVGGEGYPLSAEQAAARNAFYSRHRDRAVAAFDEERQVERLQRAGQQANRQNVLDEIAVRRQVLSEVRSMGRTRGAEIPLTWAAGTERARLEPMFANAQDSYPSDWLRANAAARPGGVRVDADRDRGYFDPNDHKINPGRKADDGALQATVTHEMMHSMEYTIPGLSDAEVVFLRDRTSRGEVGSRSFDSVSTIFGNERGYQDDFREHYTGRVYGPMAVGRPAGYEVLTTGMESLFAPGQRSFTDADMEHFVLGALALF
jgi:hypothetical protein